MNQFNFVGNLTKAVETRTVKVKDVDTQVANVSLALNGKDDNTTFVNITVWGKQAELCSKYLEKGRNVRVTGRVRNHSYEKDGVKVNTYGFDAEEIEFLGGRKTKEDSDAVAGADELPF